MLRPVFPDHPELVGFPIPPNLAALVTVALLSTSCIAGSGLAGSLHNRQTTLAGQYSVKFYANRVTRCQSNSPSLLVWLVMACCRHALCSGMCHARHICADCGPTTPRCILFTHLPLAGLQHRLCPVCDPLMRPMAPPCLFREPLNGNQAECVGRGLFAPVCSGPVPVVRFLGRDAVQPDDCGPPGEVARRLTCDPQPFEQHMAERVRYIMTAVILAGESERFIRRPPCRPAHSPVAGKAVRVSAVFRRQETGGTHLGNGLA